MQEWTGIRRKVLVQGASKRSVCRDYGIAHKTLQKILANTEPPGYRGAAARTKTKLGPYLPVIEEIIGGRPLAVLCRDSEGSPVGLVKRTQGQRNAFRACLAAGQSPA